MAGMVSAVIVSMADMADMADTADTAVAAMVEAISIMTDITSSSISIHHLLLPHLLVPQPRATRPPELATMPTTLLNILNTTMVRTLMQLTAAIKITWPIINTTNNGLSSNNNKLPELLAPRM